MIGLMLGASVVPSKFWSTVSSIETYCRSGLAVADSRAAGARRKPTVMIVLQPWSTRLERFEAKSVSACDWTSIGFFEPSSAAAWSRPSLPSWLNDLSSNPPESDTMQGR